MSNQKKLALAALLPILMVLAAPIAVNAQTTTTTTTTSVHHPHFLWRNGLANPYGIFRNGNVVTVPSLTLAQSTVNNCPSTAPVQLSTGQCITYQQAVLMLQSGQLQLGGIVTSQGTQAIGTPVILTAHGYANAFQLFGHWRR